MRNLKAMANETDQPKHLRITMTNISISFKEGKEKIHRTLKEIEKIILDIIDFLDKQSAVADGNGNSQQGRQV